MKIIRQSNQRSFEGLESIFKNVDFSECIPRKLFRLVINLILFYLQRILL